MHQSNIQPVGQHDLDRLAVRRAFSAASSTYDRVAVLQTEVRTRLLERLDIVRLTPAAVLDLGCGTGQASQALQQRYPQARIIAMDAAFGMLQQAAQHYSLMQKLLHRGFTRVCADAYRLPFKNASLDLVFSNLMLQWCDPPDAVFAELRRVLKPDGVLLFTSFGPDTLKELRAAWAAVDEHTHVNRFIDMHDLGDAMVRAGLAEPVLDVERFTLTYPDVMGLMRELKAIGAHNVTAGRRHGLTGRAALNQMSAAYEIQRREDVLPATYEVVYGQAWGNDQPLRSVNGEVRIPLSQIGRRQ
ncbi:MAG: malonyl-ACP O-methyltransferase BioC [Steroidobacteraceae bacterium]